MLKLIALANTLLLATIAGQTAPQDQSDRDKAPREEYKVVCPVRIICVNAEVTDSLGQEVRNLTHDDITVYEDGEEQVLHAFRRIESVIDGKAHTKYEISYFFSSRKAEGYRKIRVIARNNDGRKLKVKITPRRYYATKDAGL